MQCSNVRLLTAISDHLGEVNLINFVPSLTRRVINWKLALIFSPVFQTLTLIRAILLQATVRRVAKGGGEYRSRFTENKAALSQFTKNTTLAFYASRKMRENFLENHGSRRLWKLRFTRKTLAISDFTGKKKGPSQVTKIPFTTPCKP